MKQNTAVVLFLGVTFLAFEYDSIVCGIFAAMLGMLLLIEIL